MTIQILPKRLQGKVEAISSKSALHRQVICAFLGDRPVRILCRGISQDILATAGCISALGGSADFDDIGLTIAPHGSVFPPDVVLDCGESGSTARFVLPVAAALTDNFMLTGSGRLPERPMGELIRALAEKGCHFSAENLPMTITGRLRPGEFYLPGGVSSQYVSGLLMALPLLEGPSRIIIEGPLASGSYVALTLSELERFGIVVEEAEDGFIVPGGQQYKSPAVIQTEGDWSNAAFWLCADALGGNITISGLDNNSLQGDRKMSALLKHILEGDQSSIDIDDTPDLLPILTVAACAAHGKTVFSGAGRLRLKESDRLTASRDMIRSLGGRAETTSDSLTVFGSGKLIGGVVDGQNDHRIVMAAAIAAEICDENVKILGAEAVNKSYPDFFRDLIRLGGTADVV